MLFCPLPASSELNLLVGTPELARGQSICPPYHLMRVGEEGDDVINKHLTGNCTSVYMCVMKTVIWVRIGHFMDQFSARARTESSHFTYRTF